MTYVVRCNECEQRVADERYVKGEETACYRVALEHVRETGHTGVDVQGDNHWMGDGEPPHDTMGL